MQIMKKWLNVQNKEAPLWSNSSQIALPNGEMIWMHLTVYSCQSNDTSGSSFTAHFYSLRFFRPLSLNVVCQHGINGPESACPQNKRGRDTVRWFLIKFFWSIITSLVCYVFLELSKLQALFFQTNFYLSLLSLWNFNKCLNSIRKRVFEIIVSRTIDIQVTRSVNNFVPKC